MALTLSWNSSGVLTVSGSGGQGIGTVVPTDKITSLSEVSSAELAAKITDETGSGLLVFGTSPVITGNPDLGTGQVKFGGSTSSFPSLKRAAAVLETKLADDSAYCDIKVRTIITPAVAVASLPASPVEGQRASVNDSNAATFLLGLGLVVAAGGTGHYPVYYDGTDWRIG